jgi:predicted metal-dependent hydrolase
VTLLGFKRAPTLDHGQVVDLDGRRLRLQVSARARRVSIRIDAARGEAIAVAPSRRALADAVAFARSKTGWIDERLAEAPATLGLEPGAAIPFRGAIARLEAVRGAAAARLTRDGDDWLIRSGGEGDAFARRVERLLRAEAAAWLSGRTAAHVAALGLEPPTVAVADPKSRWGSCSPHRGAIRYSWRLILAPDWVSDYVAAHEVAHLVHADHSEAFWTVVADLVPTARRARAWMRAHGAGLHAVGRR